ncbi:MAG: hypothetical protein NC078_11025 [Ruminococcus sp.]|nr:hypothetical protein [Ruminococcus sp.]
MRKSFKAKILTAAVLAACSLMTAEITTFSAGAENDFVSREYYELPEMGAGNRGVMERDGRMFSYENGFVTPFDGVTDIGGECYCYAEGCKWFGWRKMGGEWYYFDPSDNGKMATDKAKTALGTYYFADNGAWDGRYTSKAKAPADFVFSVRLYSYGNMLILDSGAGLLTNADSGADMPDEYFTMPAKVNVKDRQIIYDTLMSCGIDRINTPLTGAAVAPEATLNTDLPRFAVMFTANGKSYELTGDYGAFVKYGENADVNEAAYVTAFLQDYVKTFVS